MTQEDKKLLLKDLCGRLPYGVKVLYKGWDSDHGCEFSTVEDLIGIDDRFIHTLWRGERDKHSIVEPLSITDYKPYLRPMSSMTEEERKEVNSIIFKYSKHSEYFTFSYNARGIIYNGNDNCCCINIGDSTIDGLIDWLNEHHFDYRNLIEKGLAIEVTEENNPYKE